MTWIKVKVPASDKPVFVNMANAIYIRHNHADNISAVIGFRNHGEHLDNTRFDKLSTTVGADFYHTTDHELRLNQTVEDLLEMVDRPLALIHRMTE